MTIFTRLGVCLLCLLSMGFSGNINYVPQQSSVYFTQARINFSTAPVLVDGILYVPLRDMAKGLELEIEYNSRKDEYLVKRAKDFLTITFKLNSRKIMINKIEDELASPILLIKNSFYIPLSDFLWPLGYFVSREGNDYYIVSKITGLTWKDQVLTIQGQAPLVSSLEFIGNNYIVTLPNCILGVDPAEIIAEDGSIKKITMYQSSLSPAVVKVQIEVYKKLRYTAMQEDAETAYKLSFDYAPAIATNYIPQPVKTIEIPKPAGAGEVLFTTGESAEISSNVLWLPDRQILKSSKLTCVLKGMVYKNIDIISHKNICYVLFDDLFSNLGCRLLKTSGGYVLTDAQDRSFILADSSVAVKNGRSYVPFTQILRTIGYAAYYTKGIVYINPRVYSVSYVQNGAKRLLIKSNDKLFPKQIAYTTDPLRAVIDIPSSAYDAPINILRIHDDCIGMVRAAQFDKGVVRVAIDLQDKNNKPILSFEDHGNTIAVLFPKTQPAVSHLAGGKLQEIRITADKNRNHRLVFLADNKPVRNYQIQTLNNPDRLILSFDGFNSALKNVIPIQNGPIAQIRTSQFTWQPLQARVVIDLSDQVKGYSVAEDGSLVVYAVMQKQAAAIAKLEIPDVSVSYTAKPLAEVTRDMTTTSDYIETVVSLVDKVMPEIQKNITAIVVSENSFAKAAATLLDSKAKVSLHGLRVAIIPGHGGADAGAISRTGYMEKIPTLEVSKKIQKLLSDAGAVPLMCRESDENISLVNQAEYAIRNNADILISVHFNSFISSAVSGAESYYYKPIDYDLARLVHESIIKIPGLKNKGLKKAQMHNLNHTTMPGVLIEPLFMSNRKEEALLKDQDFQWKLAAAIVKGIENYASLKRKTAK